MSKINLINIYRELLEQFIEFDLSNDEFIYEDLSKLKNLKIKVKNILNEYKNNIDKQSNNIIKELKKENEELKELWQKNKGKIYECDCGDYVYENYCLGCDKTGLKEYNAFNLLEEKEEFQALSKFYQTEANKELAKNADLKKQVEGLTELSKKVNCIGNILTYPKKIKLEKQVEGLEQKIKKIIDENTYYRKVLERIVKTEPERYLSSNGWAYFHKFKNIAKQALDIKY